jgi:hypothetical protein
MFVQRLDKLPSCIPHARARSEFGFGKVADSELSCIPARTDP